MMKHLNGWRGTILILGLAAIAGCRPDAKPHSPRLQEALPYLPLPPDPHFVSRTGVDSAIQVVLTTPYPVDSIVVLYRGLLVRQSYTLAGDQPATGGGRTLLAIKNGQPLWIMIGPDPAGAGTRVSINGAVRVGGPDSGASKAGGAPDSAHKLAPAAPKRAPARKPDR